jgi:hypothetical protein
MPLVAAKCSNCGASLQVDSSKEAAVCQYCGTPYITEKAINYYNTTNNINANVVNIYGANSTDFEIQAGILIKYRGASADVVIPDTVRKIGDESFKELAGLTSVTIPDSVTEIGKSAFNKCINLTTVTIPNSIREIGPEAFWLCISLTNITIPNSVTEIGEMAFCYCKSLTNITIPNGVTKIGDNAFASCESLTNITIPNSVTEIGAWAFSHCKSLTNITIPNSVTEIGEWAFSSCKSLTDIIIPNGVTEIGNTAFYECESLTNITIPNSVKRIEYHAFCNCTSLESVTVRGNPRIGEQPFLGCSKLTQFYAPEDWIKRNRRDLSTAKHYCYVATCVYGSYDCPQVWTLRRYRDYTLAKTWYGRAFIRIYYTISPTIVKWFGKTNWFRKFWRGKLDRMVEKLNAKGIKDTPYQDRRW